MGARAEAENDPKMITSLADEAVDLAKKLKDAAADFAKPAADMKKKPEECKKPAGDLQTALAAAAKLSSDLTDLAKRIKTSVAK